MKIYICIVKSPPAPRPLVGWTRIFVRFALASRVRTHPESQSVATATAAIAAPHSRPSRRAAVRCRPFPTTSPPWPSVVINRTRRRHRGRHSPRVAHHALIATYRGGMQAKGASDAPTPRLLTSIPLPTLTSLVSYKLARRFQDRMRRRLLLRRTGARSA